MERDVPQRLRSQMQERRAAIKASSPHIQSV